MGEHKYNPVAIAAKNGELPKKKPKMSKRESELLMQAQLKKILRERGIPTAEDFVNIGNIHWEY